MSELTLSPDIFPDRSIVFWDTSPNRKYVRKLAETDGYQVFTLSASAWSHPAGFRPLPLPPVVQEPNGRRRRAPAINTRNVLLLVPLVRE